MDELADEEIRWAAGAVNESPELARDYEQCSKNRRYIKLKQYGPDNTGVESRFRIPGKTVLALLTGTMSFMRKAQMFDNRTVQLMYFKGGEQEYVGVRGNADGPFKISLVNFNHTCQSANCTVLHQPVYDRHGNETPGYLLVATKSKEVPPNTQLTYNYGGNILRTRAKALELIAALKARGGEAYFQKCLCEDCASGRSKRVRGFVILGKDPDAGCVRTRRSSSFDALQWQRDSLDDSFGTPISAFQERRFSSSLTATPIGGGSSLGESPAAATPISGRSSFGESPSVAATSIGGRSSLGEDLFPSTPIEGRDSFGEDLLPVTPIHGSSSILTPVFVRREQGRVLVSPIVTASLSSLLPARCSGRRRRQPELYSPGERVPKRARQAP